MLKWSSFNAQVHWFWLEAMDEGQPFLDNLHDFLTNAWLSGEASQDEVGYWTEKIRHCPVGKEEHAQERSWCAYCGSIHAFRCDNCGRVFRLEDHPDEYENIEEEGFCTRCEQQENAGMETGSW